MRRYERGGGQEDRRLYYFVGTPNPCMKALQELLAERKRPFYIMLLLCPGKHSGHKIYSSSPPSPPPIHVEA